MFDLRMKEGSLKYNQSLLKEVVGLPSFVRVNNISEMIYNKYDGIAEAMETENEFLDNNTSYEYNVNSTLYSAATIFKNDISNKKNAHCSIKSTDFTSKNFGEVIPIRLYNFIFSLVNVDILTAFDNKENMILDPKILFIGHLFMFFKKRHLSPLSFGLGIAIYNEFGSKSLLNILASYGIVCSYNIRKFLTIAAHDQIQMQDTYIPK